MSLYVHRPGLLTTIQDRGRYGMQQYGIPVSGAMDASALRIANALAGNNEEEAVLEVTLQGPEVTFEHGMLVAITGGDLMPAINGMPVPMYRPVYVAQGARLTFRGCREGCRSYVAVAGGLDVPVVLGSRSTYLRAGIGGVEGRTLNGGDRVGIRNGGGSLPSSSLYRLEQKLARTASTEGQPFASVDWFAPPLADYRRKVIRIVRGTHYRYLTEESRNRLVRQPFAVAPQSDRMGYRLSAEELSLQAPLELLSEAVANGTIQLPQDGQPIILLADRQTTGGYPRIAQVATADLPVMAQYKPGDRFGFQLVSHEEAERLLIDHEQDWIRLRMAIGLKMKEWGR